MNLKKAVGTPRASIFRVWRHLAALVPGGRILAFGAGSRQISAIVVINLDRQPVRWRKVTRELRRFRTSEGDPLVSITRRLSAVDARDGRAVAATHDVDTMFSIGDQLFVQPDPRLEASFAKDEPVRMTRQEVAVARSHIEVWKIVANGDHEHVLVLEDDVWFTPRAARTIEKGWRAAIGGRGADDGPELLYLSYLEANSTRTHRNAHGPVFRPTPGLWWLSAYVLSREGAASLLRAMPVVGPVDLWMNYRFHELDVLALSSPAISQRRDARSDNAYSVLPYLARAGVIDSENGKKPPEHPGVGPVLAWMTRTEHERLAMALSMLGLRVRVFDGDERQMESADVAEVAKTFDALVNPPLSPETMTALTTEGRYRMLVESDGAAPSRPSEITPVLLEREVMQIASWHPVCDMLGLTQPVEEFPVGASRALRLFRDDRPAERRPSGDERQRGHQMDDSPWVLPAASGWRPIPSPSPIPPPARPTVIRASMVEPCSSFKGLVETFPGNLAIFTQNALQYGDYGASLILNGSAGASRPYDSGAFASTRPFLHGRFEAEIKPAEGSGLITGFFLHRDMPRQEIDIEFSGNDPCTMLVNVYFNPGDEGATLGFGYRGSPCRVDLGFNASEAFHSYAIDWRADCMTWLVDGNVVHERRSWDPTPIPHLSMTLHANLWAPRSEELAGRVDRRALPATAIFRNVVVTG